jgi:hypothetical protein
LDAVKHWKIVLCIAGLMFVSAAFGAWLRGHHVIFRKHTFAEEWKKVTQNAMGIADRLQLNAAQRANARKALNSAVQQLTDLRELTLASELAIIKEVEEKIEADMTPEQKQKFTAMKPKPKDITLDLLLVTPEKKNTQLQSNP